MSGVSDMLNDNLNKMNNPADSLVLYILRNTIEEKDGFKIKDIIAGGIIDWARFKDLIICHEIVVIAYLGLKPYFSLLPLKLAEFLRDRYYANIVRCQRLQQAFLGITEASNRLGISVVPIKGVALLEDIYKGRNLRQMADIDILVKENDFSKLEGVLYGLGYKKELGGLKEGYWKKSQCHISFLKKESGNITLFIDAHWALDFKRKNRVLLPKLWDRVRKLDFQGRNIEVLSPEDTFISLAMHNRRFGRVLGFKNICDSALLLDKYASCFDWSYVLEESRKSKFCSTVFFALCCVKILFSAHIPDFVWKELKVGRWKRLITTRFIERNIYYPVDFTQDKDIYLKAHFLLYDSILEPITYILNIPQEQFAKFYNLVQYSRITGFFYRCRFLYIPFKAIFFKNKNGALRHSK